MLRRWVGVKKGERVSRGVGGCKGGTGTTHPPNPPLLLLFDANTPRTHTHNTLTHTTGEEYLRNTRALLLRASLMQHDLIQARRLHSFLLAFLLAVTNACGLFGQWG